MQKPILTTYLLFILTACQSNNSVEQKEEEGKSKVSQTSENVVTVKLAASKIKSFPLQVMATGKVTALTQAKINFKSSGVIEKIMVFHLAVPSLHQWRVLYFGQRFQVKYLTSRD